MTRNFMMYTQSRPKQFSYLLSFLLVIGCISSDHVQPAYGFTRSIYNWLDSAKTQFDKKFKGDEDAMLLKALQAIDRNNDNEITYNEMSQWFKEHRPKHFQWHMDNIRNMRDIDTDGDGSISREERKAYDLRYQLTNEEKMLLLDNWDTNQNEVLEPQEIRAMKRDTRTWRELAETGHHHKAKHEMRLSDKNGDGLIDAFEYGSTQTRMQDRQEHPDPERHFIQICEKAWKVLKNGYKQYDSDDPDVDFHESKCSKELGKEMWNIMDEDGKGGWDYGDVLKTHSERYEHFRNQHRHYETVAYISEIDKLHNRDRRLQILGETHTEDGTMHPHFKEHLRTDLGTSMRMMLLDYYKNHLEAGLQ